MVFNETELIQVLSGADIRKELRDNAVSLRWATVTNLMPLEVQRDGEFESFAVTGSAVDASLLEVGDRVRVSNFGSKAFIESSQNALTRLYAPPDNTGWVNLTIETTAGSPYGTPGVRRINGIVYLRGGVGNDAGIPNTKLCDLPAGFHPATTMFMSAGAADAPGQTVGIYSGAIFKRSSGANPRFLHFDGLSYPTT